EVNRNLGIENENGNGGGDGNGDGNNGGDNSNGNGNRNVNRRGNMLIARECTYQDFMKCQPLNFKGTKGVESQQLEALQDLLGSVILSDSIDGWVWDLNGDGIFRVKDARNLLDEFFLPKEEVATKWIKSIPIKVNVFAWKLHLDRLPTRLNLVNRGVQVLSTLCPICRAAHEDASHIFLAVKSPWMCLALFAVGGIFLGRMFRRFSSVLSIRDSLLLFYFALSIQAEQVAKKGSASSNSLKFQKRYTFALTKLLRCLSRKLKTHTSHKVLKQLDLAKKWIGSLADFYKHTGHLPSDWEYHPDTATSCVPIKGSLAQGVEIHSKAACLGAWGTLDIIYHSNPIPRVLADVEIIQNVKPQKLTLRLKNMYVNRLAEDYILVHPDTASSFKPIRCHQVPAKKEPKKNIRRNPHIDSAPLVGKPAKAAWQNSKKLDIKLKIADKVAKKRSASSQSDYQKIDRVTPSKAPMMAPKFEIPEAVYVYVNLVFKAEQQLKTRPSDEVLLQRLSYYKQQLGIVADLYKKSNHLASDWQ
ncbi:RNA-directed DNA polymerase, eukaryota, partial [Tanacetum coccineum]